MLSLLTRYVDPIISAVFAIPTLGVFGVAGLDGFTWKRVGLLVALFSAWGMVISLILVIDEAKRQREQEKQLQADAPIMFFTTARSQR